MDFISCAPSRVYRAGGFYEAPEQLAALLETERDNAGVAEALSEIFAPFHYDRPLPQAVLTTATGFRDSLLEHYGAINRTYRDGAASVLVALRDAAVFQNVVYVEAARRLVVYETYRKIDRDYVPLVESGFEIETPAPDDGHANFFLGSAGSFNYGHWLTDDLPRVQALLRLPDARPVRIWVTSYNEAIDRVRQQSLRNFLQGHIAFEVRLLDQRAAIRFDSLLYATPVSYHPLLKNPAALEFVSQSIDFDGLSGGYEKIFITRRPDRGRALTNTAEIEVFLTRRGFQAVDVEALGFAEQAYLFSRARIIIGCMGAAMTNMVFAKPSTATILLAPEGWIEPYYWDIAAIRKQHYFVCFGPVEGDAQAPHLSSYRIELAMISAALEILDP